MPAKFDEEERLALSKLLENWGKKREEIDEYIDKKIKDGMIFINENGNVRYINLCYQFYEPKRSVYERFLGEHIGELRELEGLILNGNHMNGVLPDRLGDLSKLTELNLSENDFSGSLPPSMSKLRALTHLNLSDNPNLKGNVHTQVMKYCPHLKHCLFDIHLWHHIQKDTLRKLVRAMKRKKKKKERGIYVMGQGASEDDEEQSVTEKDGDISRSDRIDKGDGSDTLGDGNGTNNDAPVSPLSSPEKPIANVSITDMIHAYDKKKKKHARFEEEETEEEREERERLEHEKRQQEIQERNWLEEEEERERLRMLDYTIDCNMKTWIESELQDIANKPEVKLVSENDTEYNPMYEVVYDSEDSTYRLMEKHERDEILGINAENKETEETQKALPPPEKVTTTKFLDFDDDYLHRHLGDASEDYCYVLVRQGDDNELYEYKNRDKAMQDLERVKYIRMKTFKKGTEEREDLMVAYRKWAVKIADEKKKRIEEVTEARRKKLKEDYFREQAKKQRKKGYMGMKQLVQKHISELKTTNTALGNDGEEHELQAEKDVDQEPTQKIIERRDAMNLRENQEIVPHVTDAMEEAIMSADTKPSRVDKFINRRMRKKGQKFESEELRLGVMPHQNDRDPHIGAESDIFINSKGEVIYIDFSNCELDGYISEDIGNLKSLTHLDLSDNKLRGSIPDSIGRLKQLKIMDVSHNQLSGHIPDTIGKLGALTELYVGVNALEGRIPDVLGHMHQLTYFTLIGNKRIEGPIPESLHSRPIQDGSTELACDLQSAELEAYLGKKRTELRRIKEQQKLADDRRLEHKRLLLDKKENNLREKIHNKEVQLEKINATKSDLKANWRVENNNIVEELQKMVVERPLTKVEREKKANIKFLASRIKNLPQFPNNRNTVIEEIHEMIEHSKDEEQKQQALELISKLSDTTLPIREYLTMSKEVTEIFYITGIVCGREAENAAYQVGQKIFKLQQHPGDRNEIITSLKEIVVKSKDKEQQLKRDELCERISAFGKVFRFDPLLQMDMEDQKCLLECLETMWGSTDEYYGEEFEDENIEKESAEQKFKNFISRRMNYDRIKVNESRNITILDLSKAGLRGRIPKKIGHFKHLRVLNLSKNSLDGVLPSSLGNMHRLEELNLGGNKHLTGFLPAGIPQDCVKFLPKSIKDAVGGLREKKLKTRFDYMMIISYICVTYIDLISDILATDALFRSEEPGPVLATLNVFFILGEALMAFTNSDAQGTDIVLNLLFLQTAVDGINSLYLGKQTQELVLHKKLDAIVRSLPGIALQFYSLLNDLEDVTTDTFRILLFSVLTGVMGSSFTLATSHPKAGSIIGSKEFAVCVLYYIFETWTRVSTVSIGFLCLSAFGILVACADFAIRRYWIALDEDGRFDEKNISYAKTFLFLGSDNAVDEKRWKWGSLLNFAELLIFASMMLFIPGVHLTGQGFSLIPWPLDSASTNMLLVSVLFSTVMKVVMYYYIDKMETEDEMEVDEHAMDTGEDDKLVQDIVAEKIQGVARGVSQIFTKVVLGKSQGVSAINMEEIDELDEEAQLKDTDGTTSRPSSSKSERLQDLSRRNAAQNIQFKLNSKGVEGNDEEDNDSGDEELEMVGTLRSRSTSLLDTNALLLESRPSSTERRISSRDRHSLSRESRPNSRGSALELVNDV